MYICKNIKLMQIHSIDAGLFKLDGGAMFGVVPKTMWSKLNPPDANNLCTWAMRCMLIESGSKLILIDTGMGSKQDEKFRSHFHPHGEGNLVSSIQSKGYSIEDVTDVILTHLHFDHCGGAIYRNEDKLIPQFNNARYWTHEDHLDWALTPNDREKASFLKENILPIQESGQLTFLQEDSFKNWGITFDFVYGHTEAMAIPYIDYNGKTIIFAADLMPSSYHIPMPFVMAYDIRPLETLSEREKLYQNVLDKNGFIFFEHDPVNELGSLKKNDHGRIVIDQLAKISDL
jgi:glyoxylase-like metal-dependent hydrolase (beta-lactamase superfamily II)